MGRVRDSGCSERPFAGARNRRPRSRRRRLHRLGLSLIAAGLAFAVGSMTHKAEARWTATSLLDQWVWASGGHSLGGVAVRPDGYLIVASDDGSGGDGYLHLIPPWGASISASNRFGPPGLHPYHLVLRTGRLYVTRWNQVDPSDQDNHISVLDAATGQLVKTIAWFGGHGSMGIAVDPQGARPLVIEGGPAPNPQPFLYQVDPDTGVATRWMTPPPSEQNDNLAFSWDGAILLYAANGESAGFGTEYGFDRSGNLQFAVHGSSANPTIGGAVLRQPSNDCFGSNLYYTSGGVSPTDGTALYQIPPPYSANNSAVAAQKPVPSASSQYSDIKLDTGGHLVVSLTTDVVVMSCPNSFVPPTPPPGPTAGSSPGPRPPGPNAPGGQPGAVAPQSGPPPPGAAPPGPPAAAAQPASAVQPQAAGAAQQAHQAANQATVEASTQGGAAPNAVGLVDVVDDSPAMSFSASRIVGGDQGAIVPFAAVVVCLTLAGAAAVWRGDRSPSWRVAQSRLFK